MPLSAKFLFQVAFCAVSLAIVWGTMLERTKFAVYVIFAVVFAGLIYPLVGHWIWGGGWLTELGMQDFAGSTVVHLSGAMAALAGTLLLGPRLGKYDDEGRPVTIPGHNMPLAVLGVLILWVGWYGFNPGSTMAASTQIADIALTTTLAAAAGVLGAMLMSYAYRRNVDVGMGGNGAIAALVAITAPCAFVAPWASIVIGFLAGVIMYATLVFVDKIGVDDPLGAIAAHGMGGIWGTLSCGLFTTPALAAVGEPGLFYGGGFYQLGIQALGIVACGGFVFLASSRSSPRSRPPSVSGSSPTRSSTASTSTSTASSATLTSSPPTTRTATGTRPPTRSRASKVQPRSSTPAPAGHPPAGAFSRQPLAGRTFLYPGVRDDARAARRTVWKHP